MTSWIVPALLLAVPVVFFGIISLVFRAGKKARRKEEQAEDLKAVQDKKKKDEEVRDLSDGELDRRFKRWMPDR